MSWLWIRRGGRTACGVIAIAGGLVISIGQISRAVADSNGNAAAKKPGNLALAAKQQPVAAKTLSAAEEKILHALATPTSVAFVDTQLTDAIAFLKDQHGIPIRLDSAALKGERIAADSPINLHLSDISLHSCLNLMLKPLKLGFTVEDDALKVTTLKKLEKQELPAALIGFATRDRGIQQNQAKIEKKLSAKTKVDFKATQIKDALKYFQEQHGINILAVDTGTKSVSDLFDSEVTFRSDGGTLRDALNQILIPAKLKFWVEDEVLKVGVQDADEQRLRRIKTRKQDAAEKARDAADEKVYRALAKPITVPFIDTQLQDALTFLQQQNGVVFQLDNAALKEESIKPDIAINLQVDDVSLYSTLNLALNDKLLGFTVEEGVIKVTTQQALTKKKLPDALANFVAEDRRIQQKHAALEKALGKSTGVDFKDVALRDALYHIYQQEKIPLYLSEVELTEAKVPLDTLVRLNKENAPVRDILKAILDPLKLKFQIENEMVKIGAQDADEQRLRRIKARKEDAAGKSEK